MGNLEVIPGGGIYIIAIQCLTWRIGNRMYDAIQPIPVAGQCFEHTFNMFIDTDITFHRDIGITFGSHFFNAPLQFVILKSKSQFGAFPVHSLCNSPGNRPVARQTNYQDTFALHKTHYHLPVFLLIQ